MIWLEIFCDVEDVPDPLLIRTIDNRGMGDKVINRWAIVQWELDENYEAIIDSGQRIIGSLSFNDAIIIANGIKHKLNASGLKVTVSNPNPKSRFTIKSVEYELLGYDWSRMIFFDESEPYEA
ncbi:hypothetical protein LCGC14_1311450 [marine sediment metagenome]|uniref:Uncharacterized protein n=1 Tax=marine sediment metagenome TaxID=412755 RepID=A0A0F9KMP3_9ZZZZ